MPNTKILKHISLFSGIGGFDLAAEWMGWENVAHCEWNPFGRRILNYYWPNAISYEDITKTDFTIHRGNIDIVTGGFPCQPYSVAGKRKGTEDERHLWPEMLRAIREIAPSWVVGENVRGLVNWDGGLVFDQVQADLETAGYEVFPFLLPAAGVNAPHRRDRIWFVAYSKSIGGRERVGKEIDNNAGRKDTEYKSERNCLWNRNKTVSRAGISTDTSIERCNNGSDNRKKRYIHNYQDRNASENKSKRHRRKRGVSKIDKTRNVTKSDSKRQKRRKESRNSNKSRKKAKQQPSGFCELSQWEKFPTQPPVYNGNDGISSQLDGITFSKWRSESIKAGGNAIVPQVALQIFKAIEKYETQDGLR